MELILALFIGFGIGITAVTWFNLPPWAASILTLISIPIIIGALLRLEWMFEKEVSISKDVAEKIVRTVEKARSYSDFKVKAFIAGTFPLFCSHYHCNTRMLPVYVNRIESCERDGNVQLGWGGCPQIVCPCCLHNETDPCSNGND